ncbi:MAG: 23S rRNA (uracil(1939)-C(5))-methyltransferase RlmD [Lachnospiraceae bacterium]
MEKSKAGSIIKKNSIVELKFVDLTYEGLGVAKHDGLAIFVKGALPGESGKVRISKVEKRFAFGEIINLDVNSPDRMPVENKALDSTIPLQHLSYDKQLQFKTKIVKDIFAKRSLLKDTVIRDTIAAKDEWNYRNKTQVPVRSAKGKMETGVFANDSHRLIPVDNFKINLPGIDEMVSGVRDILISLGEKPYDESTHTGNIRHIIVRKSSRTEEAMVIIITRSNSLFPKSKIIPAITERFPDVVSIVHNINNRRTAAIFGDKSEVLFGKASYEEKVAGKSFDITAQSFLQVNIPQAEVLYEKALALLDLKGTETVLDAYCGIGTISLALADRAKRVIGIEVIPEAVEIAKVNAEKNWIENVEFECGPVEDVIADLKISLDAVVVDPPRKGLEPAFIDALLEKKPVKLVYISCNPATLVRDLERFVEAGYELSDVQPVDLFPQTPHCEIIVEICRK